MARLNSRSSTRPARSISRLPTELWLSVLCYLAAEDVQRLSSTSRSLRSLLLPHVVSTITIRAQGSPSEAARSLSKAAYAHRHVRHIHFKHPCADGSARSSPGYAKAARTISKIISQLPHLHSVVLEQVVLTVDFRRALFGSPSLRSLALHHVDVSPLRAEKTASKITHLTISNVVTRDTLHTLVSDLSHSLESIELGEEVYSLLAKLYGGTFPKLRRLIVHPSEGSNPTLLAKLLIATPTLTTLALPTTSVLPDLPSTALPCLSELAGPAASLLPLVKTRPVRSLRILDRDKATTTFGDIKAILACCPALERLELPNQLPDMATLCYRLETLAALPCGATLVHLGLRVDARADDDLRMRAREGAARGAGAGAGADAVRVLSRTFPLVVSSQFGPVWRGRAVGFPRLARLHVRVAARAGLSARYCRLWAARVVLPRCPRLRGVEYTAHDDDDDADDAGGARAARVDGIRYWRVVGGPWETSVRGRERELSLRCT